MDLFVSSVIVHVCVLLSRPIKGLKWHGFLSAFVLLSVICLQACVLLCNCFRFHFVCTALAYVRVCLRVTCQSVSARFEVPVFFPLIFLIVLPLWLFFTSAQFALFFLPLPLGDC